jgi:hypothetical protein
MSRFVQGDRFESGHVPGLRRSLCDAGVVESAITLAATYYQLADETVAVEEQLLHAVRERPVGESVLTAVGRFWLERFDRIADRNASAGLATMAHLVTASPALEARERQIFARYGASLASLIADETGASADDLEPRVAAAALVDVQRALLDTARQRVLRGNRGAGLARELRSEGERVLALLERGLGRYAIK